MAEKKVGSNWRSGDSGRNLVDWAGLELQGGNVGHGDCCLVVLGVGDGSNSSLETLTTGSWSSFFTL